jgi:signal transduction histidine kinase
MNDESLASRLLNPLALASYVAFAAVWFANSGLLGRAPSEGPWADMALLIFLLCWLWFLMSEDDDPSPVSVSVLVLMGASILWLLLQGFSGSSPILLILLATRLAVMFTWPVAVGLLLAINGAYFLILDQVWGANLSNSLINVAAHGSFQMFAYLVLRYGRESERMAEELRLVNADLMATRTLLADSARDQERLRLSRELHDVAGHKLTALKMNLRTLRGRADEEGREALGVADVLAGELLDDLRAVVAQLRKSDGLSLEQGIRQLAAPLGGLELHLDLADEFRMERVVEAQAFLDIVREGLTNAVRHGRASAAWLQLSQGAGHWQLKLEDNGKVSWPIKPGMGLRGMRERIESLDGSLDFQPSARGGLCLTARLPLETGR